MSKAFSVTKMVTEKILSAMKEGVAIWVRPWATRNRGLPRNGNSGRYYTGINALILSAIGWNYSSDDWYTFKGAKRAGGNVRKGEKGTKVAFWKLIEKNDEEGNKVNFPLLRYYTVFNRDQIEGLPELPDPVEPLSEVERDARIDAFIAATGATVRHGGERAVYDPVTDTIGMPNPERFVDTGSYYATLLHEVIHWTGHNSRMDRFGPTSPTRAERATEELVAEMGAAFLCAIFAVDGKLQHPEYLSSWVAGEKNKEGSIMRAASTATKAVNHLSSVTGTDLFSGGEDVDEDS